MAGFKNSDKEYSRSTLLSQTQKSCPEWYF